MPAEACRVEEAWIEEASACGVVGMTMGTANGTFRRVVVGHLSPLIVAATNVQRTYDQCIPFQVT